MQILIYFIVSPVPQLGISQRPIQFMRLQKELWFRKISQLTPENVTTITITAAAPAMTSA